MPTLFLATGADICRNRHVRGMCVGKPCLMQQPPRTRLLGPFAVHPCRPALVMPVHAAIPPLRLWPGPVASRHFLHQAAVPLASSHQRTLRTSRLPVKRS